MTKDFNFNLIGTGWSETVFSTENKTIRIVASYLSQPITNLFVSILRLTNNKSISEKIFFAEEPGEHCLILTKNGDGVLNVEIFWSDEWDGTFSPAKNLGNETLVYSDIDTLENFVNKICIGTDKLLQNTSLKEYKLLWCSPFPIKLFNKLKNKFYKISHQFPK